jgi:CheY-like chemotaxis protein
MPDLVLLDIRMEEPDTGWKVLARLRSEPETCETPVIMCSANLDRRDQIRDWAGVTKVFLLPIPFDVDDLFSIVAKALDVSSAP